MSLMPSLVNVKGELDDILGCLSDGSLDPTDIDTIPDVRKLKEPKYASCRVEILRLNMVEALKEMTSRTVHLSTLLRDKSNALKEVEMEGLKLCLASPEAVEACKVASDRGRARPGMPCMLCQSEIHKVLPGRYRRPEHSTNSNIEKSVYLTL